MRISTTVFSLAALLCFAAPTVRAQTVLDVRATCDTGGADGCQTIPRSVFRVDDSGSFVAPSLVGIGVIPASGEGLRFMWHAYKGAMRAGAASAAGEFDEANIGFYSWAGGNRTIADDFASFAFGDQVTVTGAAATGFGGNSTVNGNFGFSAGSQNLCTGFTCTAIGFTARAQGQGAFALGYRTTANADYSFALGRMASTNDHTGAFVWGDASVNDSVRATANNQFTVRARGGIRLRTSTATADNVGVNGNTGCDIAGNSGVMSCASSRTLKENFLAVDGEEVLARIRATPVTTWNYIDEEGAVRHMGPMAEDFGAAFALGINNTTIGHIDIDGVNFAGVQALDARTRAQDEEIAALRAEVGALRSEVAALRDERVAAAERLAHIEAVLARIAPAGPSGQTMTASLASPETRP
jgi:hypothetical protein